MHHVRPVVNQGRPLHDLAHASGGDVRLPIGIDDSMLKVRRQPMGCCLEIPVQGRQALKIQVLPFCKIRLPEVAGEGLQEVELMPEHVCFLKMKRFDV